MARILTPDYDAALAELQSVAPAKLDRHDQELLAAARGVAAFLREPPGSSAEPPPADAAAMASANPNDAVAQTIVLAEAALGRTAPLPPPRRRETYEPRRRHRRQRRADLDAGARARNDRPRRRIEIRRPAQHARE